MKYIGTQVEIITSDEATHTGSVYTVDPVSGSIVLANRPTCPETDKLDMKIILGHAISSCTPQPNKGASLNMDELFKPKKQVDIPSSELKLSQERLRSWLLKNRLPVSVCEEDA